MSNSKFPLPAMKPNADGTGYTFCPQCALMWAALIAIGIAVFYYVRKDKSKI